MRQRNQLHSDKFNLQEDRFCREFMRGMTRDMQAGNEDTMGGMMKVGETRWPAMQFDNHDFWLGMRDI